MVVGLALMHDQLIIYDIILALIVQLPVAVADSFYSYMYEYSH